MVPDSTKNISVARTGSTEVASSKDTAPPQFVSVAVGSDPSLFGGKFYLSFFAQDSQSGVDHYEVKEGLFGGYVRADRYYVLHDQSLRSDISVRAVDVAGNTVIATIPAAHQSHTLWLFAGGILAVLLLFVVRRIYIKKKK